MTITVDITPEVKAALARQAAARGRAVESYAASLLAKKPSIFPPRLLRRRNWKIGLLGPNASGPLVERAWPSCLPNLRLEVSISISRGTGIRAVTSTYEGVSA